MKTAILSKNNLNLDIKEQVSELFRQLSPNKIQLDLEEILNEENQITVAYCEDDNKIIGIASMCTYKVISGHKGWIEDVVVDSASRGKGIGRKLINLLVEVGKEKELSEILLFTEDHRLAAINLYSSVGFKLKESKIYCKKKL
ncbi:GNAT family N-acetyltransferase [Flavobacterium turcicum]|uniref:GNAT family N-acetyltransferase n=1 Tax=Flavobacterium turcicum TaxID=2764718 RepID=A0ABR7JJH8_9FLAO|nr:GNAT family N-acetyltransferase [Flavobacterium turcicum]MBC5864647.1 GNAT family N-acetyltransferase [Flavobacterium turcicum]NHL03382.1 GNAT family N-acetyltransferase [Flavobacterium turcicum]